MNYTRKIIEEEICQFCDCSNGSKKQCEYQGCGLLKLLERTDKYSWHSLINNCEDLPTKDDKVRVCVETHYYDEQHKHASSYSYWDAIYSVEYKAFYDKYGFLIDGVIGWKHEELFDGRMVYERNND